MLAIRPATTPPTTEPASPPPSTTVPTTAPTDTTTVAVPDTTLPPASGGGGDDSSGPITELVPSVRDVISGTWDNLWSNGYQLSSAVIAATIAFIMLRTVKVQNYISIPVTAGAFWFGWWFWNLASGQTNPLFAGDPDETEIWDVAFRDEWGFLIATVVGCIAAVAMWRQNQNTPTRLVLIAGTFFGASLAYSAFDAVVSA